MFYRKHRPQTLSELDNPEIRERLSTILKGTDIPHAFLFTGPKGTGKTSAARIIAKILNCEKKVLEHPSLHLEPCNQCSLCTAITKGTALDVVELDGASHRRIDDIRELTNSVNLAPVYGAYKVYIIDEVHMLTTEAFNALLKTLEEPPSHVVFILATTEEDKVPSTIVSRCIEIQFQKASALHIKSMIDKIKKKEEFTIDDDAIQKIIEHSDGSFRDATKVLEEALVENEITSLSVSTVVNLGNSEEFLHALVEKDSTKALTFIQSYADEGKSFKGLIESVLSQLHTIMLVNKGLIASKDKPSLSLSAAIDLTRRMQQAYKELRNSPIEQLPLELAVIEYLEHQK